MYIKVDKYKNTNSIYTLWEKWLIFISGFILGVLVTCLLFYVTHPAESEKVIYIPEPDTYIEAQRASYIYAVHEEEPEIVEPRYGFTDDEVYLLAQLLVGDSSRSGDGEYDFEWYISKGLTPEQQFEIDKVLHVVMNRVMGEGIYANNVRDVVLQPNAFTVFPRNSNSVPSEEVISIIEEWCYNYDYNGTQAIPEDHYWFSADGKGSNKTRDYWRK